MPLHVVTGMHRSGTSALAGALMAAGVDLGDEKDHLPPAPDNPRGFFELRAFKELNDHILEKFEATWDAVPTLVGSWWERDEFAELRGRASALATRVGAGDGDFTVKDPRASLTLPLWRAVADVAGVVLVVRDPDEVAASLSRRNGMDPSTAAELWLRYLAAGLAHAPHAEVIMLRDLFSEPVATLSTVASALHHDPDDLDLAAGAVFLDRDLITRRPSLPDLPALRSARLAYDALLAGDDLRDLVVALERRETDATLDPLEAQAKAVARAVGVETHAIRADATARVEKARAEATRVSERLSEFRKRAVELEGRLGESRGEARRLRAEHALQSEELRRLRDQEASARREAEEHLLRARRDAHRAKQAQERAETRYRRLRNRRFVRLALALASLARPLFRVVRRLRGGRTQSSAFSTSDAPPTATEISGDVAATSGKGSERLALPQLLSGRGDQSVPRGRLRAAVERARARPVTVLVPVYDAPGDVERCLESLRRHSPRGTQVLVIDDASRLPDTRETLKRFSSLEGVTLLRNDENLGFTRTVNRGLAHCETDVVLLNSDTVVGPGWLTALQVAAYVTGRTGSATAISDNAGAFSVPDPGSHNPVPAHLDVDAAARLAGTGPWRLPETPTANGFCAYLRRDMLDDVGLLDAEAFPRGYGEENDLSMRAIRAGWSHVVADGAFVHHVRSASFGEDKRDLMSAGRAEIEKRHPDYKARVRDFMRGEPMRAVRERTAERWRGVGRDDGRPRLLFVVHAGRGGTPMTAADLALGMAEDWDPFLLTSDTRTLVLSQVQDGAVIEIDRLRLDEQLRFGEQGDTKILSLYTALLLELAVDVLHVRHIAKNSLDLLTAAEDLGVPMVISLHDFYLSCPTVHLMDEHGQFCGGVCTAGDGPCPIPMGWVARDVLPLKHDGVHRWREQVAPLLTQADELVTTSPSVREVFLRSYPQLAAEDITIIEHGRDLDFEQIPVTPPEPGGPVRLLLAGNLDYHKGTDFVRRMLRADTAGRLEVHLLGTVRKEDRDLGTHHGRYAREEFSEKVAAIEPHFIGVLSVTAESYSHTLSEAFMTGLPIVATDIGAVGDRLRTHGGGLLVPVDAPEEALEALFEAVDTGRWATLAMSDATAVRPVDAMVADYDLVYRQAIARRRGLRSADWGQGLLRVVVVTPGAGTAAPASSHVRLLRPLQHRSVRADVDVRHLPVEDLADVDDVDVVVVHRNALEAVDHEAVLSQIARRGLPLVVDLDDMLFDPERLPVVSDRDWGPAVAAVRTAMQAAAVVTVSTEPLADAARQLAGDVRVLPNAIDEGLWFPVGAAPSMAAAEDGPLRLLYMGSRTHMRDLDLLEPVIEELRTRHPAGVEVGVVGGEREPRGWYERITIPQSQYPRFVPWLRSVAEGYDIGVAPLVADSFNEAKSDLKWLEYTALGLPGVFSDVPSYRSVTHGKTGLLAGPDPSAWADALLELAQPERRTEILAAARHEVIGHRTLARTAFRWVSILREARNRNATKVG